MDRTDSRYRTSTTWGPVEGIRHRRTDSRRPRECGTTNRLGGDRVSGAEAVPVPGDQYLVAVEAAVDEDVVNLLRG